MDRMSDMRDKYAIGLDFGTLSGRGVLARCRDGEIVSCVEKKYTHGVLQELLPYGQEQLPLEWCLQYPEDYKEVLIEVIPSLIKDSGILKEDIIGIGIDFTACTIVPIDKDGIPLCEKPKYFGHRNAYAKLWKHHGAQMDADKINNYLIQKGMQDNPRFGGIVSPELMIPKVMEILREDEMIYQDAAEIIEAGDWLTQLLTGTKKRSCSMAGYKMWWNHKEGYPHREFLRALDNRLEDFVEEKLGSDVILVGEKIGELTPEWAEQLGLLPYIAVSPTIIDSHAGVPGSGVLRKGQLMLVLGTSSEIGRAHV